MSLFYKTSKIKKLCLILIFVLTLSSIGLFSQPKEVKAAPAIYVPVVDFSNLAVNTMIEVHEAGLWWKEYVLDPILWARVDELIRNILIDPILDYIGEGFWNELHWMDAGFSANIPAFIQDTIGYRIDLGDLTADAMIEEVFLLGICGTFPDGIRDGMRAAVEDTFRLFPSPTIEKAGTPIGPFDILIGATALANQSTLVTHNTTEFSRIAKLPIEDWY